jgi:hypothetical protein
MVGREPHPEKLSWIYKTGFSGSLILTVGTFILAYTTKSPELGDFLSKLLGPFFALVSSGWTADLYHRHDANKKIERDVGNAVFSARSLLQGVFEVDRRLTEATNALAESDLAATTKNLEAAIARTDGNLLHVMQSLREWQSLSPSAAAESEQNFEQDLGTIKGRREQMIPPPKPDTAVAGLQASNGDIAEKVGEGASE